jgi:hypothetical protein
MTLLVLLAIDELAKESTRNNAQCAALALEHSGAILVVDHRGLIAR